jgi:peptidoglycan hydrolase-like protein with peptidoglycan-binding domain
MGSTGDDVTTLQLFLQELGMLKQGVPLGYFGSLTSQAVASYQAAVKLKVTGVVDQATLLNLNSL